MRKVRLFLEGVPLKEGASLICDKKQSHYLSHVMRVGVNDDLTVFNGSDGLWKARVVEASKAACTLEIVGLLQSQETSPNIHLCFAPLKQTPQHILIEKATELGVTHFHPLLTERTIVRSFKEDKHKRTAIEACEQCERLDIPQFMDLQHLDKFLSTLNAERDRLYVCDERREAPTLMTSYDPDKNSYVLIGPEGGFSPGEFEKLQRHPATCLICLSPHVLRAETAAIAVLGQLWGKFL